MAQKAKLPMGIEDFEEMRTMGYYYIDKTGLIRTLLENIVIELKYAENAAFDDGCRKALKQIRDRNYEEVLVDDGMKTIYRYGIACYKKRCKVISG